MEDPLQTPYYPIPDKCPECGSPLRSDAGRFFECESWWQFCSGCVKQSDLCEMRQYRHHARVMYAALKSIAERPLPATDSEAFGELFGVKEFAQMTIDSLESP